MEAVILILKHATFLRLSNLSQESALVQAELDYQAANTELKIKQHITESSQHSVELCASFIMATDFGWIILASVQIISYQVYSAISAIS